ncbi:MAG: alkaline phosphatase family protein, partial [bacterium]
MAHADGIDPVSPPHETPPSPPLDPRIRRRRSLVRVSGLVLGLLLLGVLGKVGANWWQNRPPPVRAVPQRVIVIGFDGMDAKLTEQWMADGKLPNLRRLALANDAAGLKGYSALMSTNPSESPVSWSAMITGQNPGKTNVYDFLRRIPADYNIENAMVDTRQGVKFAYNRVPIQKPNPINYRQGDPVWKLTQGSGVRTRVLDAPVSFPPDPIPGGRLLSGLGVGDMQGTQGTYTFYTTDERQVGKGVTQFGGKLKKIFADPQGKVEFGIIGPKNKARNPDGHDPAEPIDIALPASLTPSADGAALFSVASSDGSTVTATLKPSTWSELLRVRFDLTPEIHFWGLFKVYLTQYDLSDPTFPKIGIFVSPMNLDPQEPPFPVSYPAGWSSELVEQYGRFKTIGWPSETWALTDGVLDEDAFLDDISQTQDQWEKMLFGTLDGKDWDFVWAVSQQTDHTAHMFFRFLDPKHPAYDAEKAKNPRYNDAILHAYQRADSVVGTIMDKYLTDGRTILVVVSDHGFCSFQQSVNINRWLADHGFMTLKLPPNTGTAMLNTSQLFSGDQFFTDVDWTKTKAYAMGLGQIYLNLAGREGQGVVQPGAEEAQVKADIQKGLLAELDPATKKPFMKNVYDGKLIYHGQDPANVDQTPDLVMGFYDHYRVSWQTSLGGAPLTLMDPNTEAWSGDHCSFDPSQ